MIGFGPCQCLSMTMPMINKLMVNTTDPPIASQTTVALDVNILNANSRIYFSLGSALAFVRPLYSERDGDGRDKEDWKTPLTSLVVA